MRPDDIRPSIEAAARAPEATLGLSERIPRLLLTRSPLGYLVRRVAGIRASVHAKLLGAFLLIALLLIAMGAMSLRAITSVSRNSQLLEQAHERVEASRQIEHTVAVQMNFIRNALVLRDEATIGSVLRESHRFTKTLTLLEEAAPPGEGETIRRIRTAQDRVVTKVQDIAKLIGEGKSDDAMALHLNEGYPLYREIAALVTRVVQTEEAGMDGLRQRVAAANRQALFLMGGFAAASIVLALLLGFVISWSFILPVREAEGFLGRIAKGDFGATIDVPNRDEFGALAGRMNQMSRELRELYEDLRRAAHQLQTLNLELERASKAKSDFLASMSHELRTPMNAILGFTEMVLDDVYGDVPPAIREPVSDIHACGKQLLRLINDVLDLSKIEAGRMELALGDYSVEDVVNTVKSSLRSLAVEKGLDFVTTVQPDTPSGFGDSKRITQCLVNLAGNALKFTQEGRVEIRVELEGETLLFAVSDTGIGIPPHQREHIFEEFRQVDPTVTQELGGTGLGLSITRKFVELHGGRISGGERAGEGIDVLLLDPRASGARGHRVKTVLHVEDNELNRKIVRDLLGRTAYRLVEATDGLTGLATAQDVLPDLIIMDIQLPKLSGLDATRRLRAEPRTAHVPIIVITSFALAGDEQKAREAGATAYLAKPYSPRELLQLIRQLAPES